MKHLVIILLITPAVLSGSQCELSVIVPPQEVVGYAGERISYSCTICGGRLYWRVNGTAIHHFHGEPYYLEEIQGNPGTISLVALPEINNLPIECLAYSGGTIVYSDPISILVQGKLGEPTDLAATTDFSSISLSWISPYTMSYTNMTFEVTIFVLDYNTSYMVTNISSPHYMLSYSTLNISRSSVYTIQFTVCAVNPAGKGRPASEFFTVTPAMLEPYTTQEPDNVTQAPFNISLATLHDNYSEESLKGRSGVTLYVAAGVSGSAGITILLFTVTVFSAGYYLYKKRNKKKTKLSTFEMESKSCYTTPQIKISTFEMESNSCYTTPPQIQMSKFEMESNSCYTTPQIKMSTFEMESNSCYTTPQIQAETNSACTHVYETIAVK